MTNPPIDKGEIERLETLAKRARDLSEDAERILAGATDPQQKLIVYANHGEIALRLLPKCADALESLLTQLSEAEAAGIERAAKLLDQKRSDYVQECGMYDPGTGQTEFSDGGEYAHTLEELAEDVRALALPKEGTSHAPDNS